MSNLRTRTLTGVLIVLISLLFLCLHRYSFLLFGLLILLLSLVEYYQMVSDRQIRPVHYLLSGWMLLLFLLLSLTVTGLLTFDFYFVIAGLWLLALAWSTILERRNKHTAFRRLNGGVYYVAFPWLLWPLAGFIPGMEAEFSLIPDDGRWPFFSCQLILGFFLLQWTYDTLAYISGSFFGKHKMAPEISPGKSWEGLAGGTIAVFILSVIMDRFLPLLTQADWFIIGMMVVFLGTIGDLSESALKRRFSMKDSGNLLPGHGGVLDRYDGVMLSLPAAILYVWFVKGGV